MYTQTSHNNNNPTDLRSLVEENQRLTKLVLSNTERIRKYIFWGRVMSFIYLVIIIAPIVFALIYLPPLFKNAIAPYQDLLNVTGSVNTTDTSDIFDQAQEFLNDYNKVK